MWTLAEIAELDLDADGLAPLGEVLSADHGNVDRVRHEAPLESGSNLLGDDDTRPILCFLGRRREMRRDDDVVQLEQERAVVGGCVHCRSASGLRPR